MSFFKGAFSRHVRNKNLKKQRVKIFGSRHRYRRQKKSLGGKGASF